MYKLSSISTTRPAPPMTAFGWSAALLATLRKRCWNDTTEPRAQAASAAESTCLDWIAQWMINWTITRKLSLKDSKKVSCLRDILFVHLLQRQP